jgi:hypothetical protein
VNAITRPSTNGKLTQSPRPGSQTAEDGSLLITEEQLRRFGDGDAQRGRRELRLLLEIDRDGPVYSGPTEKPDTVRIAGPQDEEAILDLIIDDLKANAEHIAPIDDSKVMEHIRSGTRRRGGIVAVIDGPGKVPVAVTILVPCQWHWSQGWFYQELVNYVHPDHRKSRHIDDLLNFSRWAVDEQSRSFGARVYLLCGVLGAWRVRAKIALYRRRFQQIGAAFLYPAPPMRGN